MKLGVISDELETATSRYFEKAIESSEHSLYTYARVPDASEVGHLDAVLVMDNWVPGLQNLRSFHCPTIGYAIDVHLDRNRLRQRLIFSRYVDHIFVAQPDYIGAFEKSGHPSVHWLPLACDPETHFAPDQRREFNVGFVGKMGKPRTDRYKTLSTVLAANQTNDISRYYSPREMGKIYSRSKIVFNKSIQQDLNMRFYEGLASGALVVTDRIGNGMGRLGEDDTYYVVYETVDEAMELIKYYLENETERQQIAARGQKWAFEHHTYKDRLDEILRTIRSREHFLAPVRKTSVERERQWRSNHMRLTSATPSDALPLLKSAKYQPVVWLNLGLALADHFRREAKSNSRAWIRKLRRM